MIPVKTKRNKTWLYFHPARKDGCYDYYAPKLEG